MNKRIICAACALLLTFCGCGFGTIASSTTTASTNPTETTADQIAYSDIAWSVDKGMYNGSEFCLFSYTNNSPFVITDMKMRFSQKADTTDEQRNDVFGYLLENEWLDEEDLSSLSLDGYSRRLADPGETISDKPMYLNSFYGATDYDIYGIMEPYGIEVSFIGSDDLIHSGEIDCTNGHYRDKGKSEAADQWNDNNPLAQLVPKPDSRVIIIDFDRDDTYWVDAYGMTSSDYDQYVAACQDMGFDVDVDEFDFTETLDFYAYDAAGNRLKVSYDSMDEEVSVDIDAAS